MEAVSLSVPGAPPTPEQIRAICLEIQAGWSESERLRRTVGLPVVLSNANGLRNAYVRQPYEFPQVKGGAR